MGTCKTLGWGGGGGGGMRDRISQGEELSICFFMLTPKSVYHEEIDVTDFLSSSC